MLIKLTLSTFSGSLDVTYLDVPPSVGGGYADLTQAIAKLGPHSAFGTLAHGDMIKVEFVDQIDPEDRTGQDERELLAATRKPLQVETVVPAKGEKIFSPRQRRMIRAGMREQLKRGSW